MGRFCGSWLQAHIPMATLGWGSARGFWCPWDCRNGVPSPLAAQQLSLPWIPTIPKAPAHPLCLLSTLGRQQRIPQEMWCGMSRMNAIGTS